MPKVTANTATAAGDCDTETVGHTIEEIRLASRDLGKGLQQTEFSVPDIHCAGCIRKIEQGLSGLRGIRNARVNLTNKMLRVTWAESAGPPHVIETLGKLGFQAHISQSYDEQTDETRKQLVRSLAVAGFAAGNIMLLSVSVWSGAEEQFRGLFHWLSAAIAFPVLAYSGRVFFASAWRALRNGHTNMDVPISIGVLLAYAMSLYDTILGREHVYFDASVALLFVLLIGRLLDHLMRQRARSALAGLERLGARGAMVVNADRSTSYMPIEDIKPGMTILLAVGERVPVDSVVESGQSDIDRSLVSGESIPQIAECGSSLQAGTLNMTAPLTIRATACAGDSFLSEMVRLIESAESNRSQYRRIIDRAAAYYAPVVHSAALLTFIGWFASSGDIHQALTIAIATLIITCPCALGLAVPIVQVIAARRLFESGIIVRDGAAIERLNEIDTVVFDKTGTLTTGNPRLQNGSIITPDNAQIAISLAAHSRHPYSKSIVAAYADRSIPKLTFDSVHEYPGDGIEGRSGAKVFRLGRAQWAVPGIQAQEKSPYLRSHTVLSRNGELMESFLFEDMVRTGAGNAVVELLGDGIEVEVLSGDQVDSVRKIAKILEIPNYQAGVMPADKVVRISALTKAGRKVLMVGDGLNDAPALTSAYVSMSPSSGSDIGRSAADLVFMHGDLRAVPIAISISRRASQLIRENLTLAILYNAVALPFAVLGYVTPLFAALAMSSSSILVVANSLRLNRRKLNAQNGQVVPDLGFAELRREK